MNLSDTFTVIIDVFECTITFVPDIEGPHARKAFRVGRPKNCFVIYRLEKHVGIKALNPGMSNNDLCKSRHPHRLQHSLTISAAKIIAAMWRHEPKHVQAQYKKKAEVEKQQHAIANPGYQYQPRKPSEKKKRMTKNKLAKLATANNTGPSATQPAPAQPPPPTVAQPAPAQQPPPAFTQPAPAFPPGIDAQAIAQATEYLEEVEAWFDTEEGISYEHNGGVLVTLPTYAEPAPRPTSRIPAFGEQIRQDELDAENNMNQFFAFDDAAGAMPNDSDPTDSWVTNDN